MLLLCMGLLQAIPRDQYEASAIDGASPLDNLLRITLPQLIKPLMPLLIACFAFNFNNFVLITLLTRGGGHHRRDHAGRHHGSLGQLHLPHRLRDSGQDFAPPRPSPR